MARPLTWYFKRLQRMDGEEIAWRLRSEVRAWVDVARVRTGAVPNRQGHLPQPRVPLCNIPAQAIERTQDCPASQAVISDAAELLDNRISFFNHDALDLGDPVDWHRDWNTGVAAERGLSHFIDYRDANKTGDCKQVWEPNRHHQLVTLALAYRLTRNTAYRDKVFSLLDAWITDNPYGYGMNWRSPLEVAIRIISWVFALDLTGVSELDGNQSERLHTAAYQHCVDVAGKFSRGSSANNHVIGEAAGVFIAACYWFPDEEKWIADAQEILEAEILNQTYPDGGSREQALSYQFFVIQFFKLCGVAGERYNHPFSDAFWQRLAGMYDFVERFRPFQGCLPMFGDQDDGYVVHFGAHIHDLNDHRSWRKALSGEATPHHLPSQMLLPDGSLSRMPRPRSVEAPAAAHAFRHAGHVILNQGGIAVLFDAAELGYGSMAAHGHADALQVCVTWKGQPVLVDSGTYDYFTHPQLREYFRSTAAHNTIRLDERDQSLSAGPFMWSERADAELVKCDACDGGARAVGRLKHYPGISGDRFVEIQRDVALNERDPAMIVEDTVRIRGQSKVERFFHIHPDIAVACESPGHYRLSWPGQTLELSIDDGSECELVTEGELTHFSPSYHTLLSGSCIVATSTASESIPLKLRCRLREVG